MPRVVGPVNATLPIDINVSGMSPHVISYKLWWRDTTSDWSVLGEGTTGDQQPDHHRQPFKAGAQLFYWVGVGGTATSVYAGIITLSQDGRVLPNGLVSLDGQTNAKGVDVQQDWANFV